MGGSAVLVLMSFFQWFGSDLGGVNGWHGIHVVGLLAALGAISITLLKMEKPAWLQAALAGGAFLIGPFLYWARIDVPEGMSSMIGFSFVFWLAFLGALAAAVMAGLKLKSTLMD